MAISIIGAGHCGCALAVDLLSRGVPVLLYAHPEHRQNIDTLQQRGYLESIGERGGRFHPQLSTSLSEAVAFSNHLVITVPAYGHCTIIAELASLDLRKHVVICITGSFFSLMARQHLNVRALVETSTSPYASRFEDGQIRILGIKKVMPAASLPVDYCREHGTSVEDIFGMRLDVRSSVLEIGLMCVTGVIHPPPTLMNAGWIETSHGAFHFYRDGISPSIGNVIDAMDHERQDVARGFDVEDSPAVVEIMNAYYERSFSTFTDFAHHSPEHNAISMAPAHLRHRFITQDVPHVLVPWIALGQIVGVKCPTMLAIVHLASVIHDVNYLEAGRNLRALGLHGATKDDVLSIVGVSTHPLTS